jgi:hypothetical protein
MTLSRRDILIAGGTAALAATPTTQALAQHAHDGVGAMPTPEEMQVVQRGGLYASMNDPKVTELPPGAFEQRFTFSPAPKADPAGAWSEAAPLPVPRSEMAWATAENDRMHIIGGYAEQQVARPYHHVFDARTRQWQQAAPIPRGANHIGVAADAGAIMPLAALSIAIASPCRIVMPTSSPTIAGTRSGRSRAVRAVLFPWSLSMGWSTPWAGAMCARSTGMKPMTRRLTPGTRSPRFRGRAITRRPLSSPG